MWRAGVLQFVAFVFVGSVAAAAALVSRCLLNYYMVFELAVALSQIIGTVIAFTLTRWLVFESGGRVAIAEFARFSLVNVMSLALATSVSSVCYRLLLPTLGITFHPDVIAQTIGLASCALPSFFAHKFYSFRDARPSRDRA